MEAACCLPSALRSRLPSQPRGLPAAVLFPCCRQQSIIPRDCAIVPAAQVIQARLAALEQDNHKEEDFGAGSDDEEYELPAASGSGASCIAVVV